MRVLILFLSALAVAGSAADALAEVLVTTTFDSNRQDWFPTNPAATGTADFWQSSGGNPGGAVRSFDGGSSSGSPSWFFQNTTTFNGDRLAAYNGSLTFDLRSNGSGSPKTNASFSGSAYDVLIEGRNGATAVYLAYVGLTSPTGNVWTPYSLTLNESAANWHYNTNFFTAPSNWLAPTKTQFQSVLDDIRSIQIRGDYWLANETTWLDNVALNSHVTAVPEPGTGALMGIGMIGIAMFALRRRWCRSRWLAGFYYTGRATVPVALDNDELQGAGIDAPPVLEKERMGEKACPLGCDPVVL